MKTSQRSQSRKRNLGIPKGATCSFKITTWLEKSKQNTDSLFLQLNNKSLDDNPSTPCSSSLLSEPESKYVG